MICSPLWLMLWLTSSSSQVLAQAPVQTFFPAAIPLSIRSPFLNVWLWSLNGSLPVSNAWPLGWGLQLSEIMGWEGIIRVDGQPYTWLGNDGDPAYVANVTNVQITPTRSIFVMQAGPMNITVTFLSPVEPADWVLQSLPFSSVSVEASVLDGRLHDVQVYSDISAEWLSGDRTSPVQWTQRSTKSSIYHEVELQSPQRGVVINHQAQDGITYFAMENRSGLTWQISLGPDARGQFRDHGVLTDTFSTAFAPISPNFTVFGIAVDLGTSNSTVGPVTWSIGYVRSPSISYTAPDGAVKELSPYFTTRYGSDIGQAIDAWTTSFPETMQRAIAFDEAVMGKASRISPRYANLVSLATRQTLGSLDITVSADSNGQPNASDVRIFMSDVGSSTASERVNPVERIYAALPALLYINASLVGPLLAPLLDAQDSLADIPYAAPDIGPAYPNATGASTGHPEQGIEQTGNMLIMLYAHARFSGDGSLLSAHYDLTKRWANYLVNQSLTPSNQFDADNEGNANMTNLAIKGIVGVKAMAEISHVLGQDADAQYYDSHAATLVSSWASLALSSDQHILGTYGNEASWALIYNIYADSLLGTNLINQTLLEAQTAFYESLSSSSQSRPNGIPLDSSSDITSAAWQMFTAATVQDGNVRNGLISSVWARANNNLTAGAYADSYDADSGTILNGNAGPAVGGLFSLLALTLPNMTIVVDPSGLPGSGSSHDGGTGNNGSHKLSSGAIVGGVVGGIAATAIAAFAASLFLRKRQRNHAIGNGEKISPERHRPTLLDEHTPQDVSAARTSPSPHPLDSGDASVVLPSVSSRAGPPAMVDRQGGGAPPKVQRERSHITQPPRTPSVLELPNAASAVNEDTVPPFPSLPNASRSSTRGGHSREARRGRIRSDRSRTDMQHASAATHLSGSAVDVHCLRTEVEDLRRVLQEIQTGGLDPPPEYTD